MEEYIREHCKQAVFQLIELCAGLDQIRLDTDEAVWLTLAKNALAMGEALNRIYTATEKPF